MKILRNFSLKGYSTMRLLASGAEIYEPENLDELRDVVCRLASQGSPFHLLGAGSNVVFAERVASPIVSLMKVDTRMEDLGGGKIRAGCSTRIQHLIRFAQTLGYGGIEYLFSLPASVGGCVFMNAGRGEEMGCAIVNVLEEVELLDIGTGEVLRERVDPSAFGYRVSPYQKRACVVLGATFRLAAQPREETELLIRERLETSKKWLDAKLPSCGSVFCRGNRFIFRLFRWLHPKSGGLAFSSKTSNWIGNHGGGTLTDFKRLTAKMERAHRFLGQTCKLEIKVFE